MTIQNNFQLKFVKNIEDHFNWVTSEPSLGVLFFETFKYNIEFDEIFFQKIQNSFLDWINNNFSKKQFDCYFYLALEYNGRKVQDYYKVWKTLQRTWNIENLISLEETKIKTHNSEYFTGLAKLKTNELSSVFQLQNHYRQSSFIIIDFGNKINSLKSETLSSYFLGRDSLDSYKMLYHELCQQEIIIVRIGDDSEEWEIAFIFPRLLLKNDTVCL